MDITEGGNVCVLHLRRMAGHYPDERKDMMQAEHQVHNIPPDDESDETACDYNRRSVANMKYGKNFREMTLMIVSLKIINRWMRSEEEQHNVPAGDENINYLQNFILKRFFNPTAHCIFVTWTLPYIHI